MTRTPLEEWIRRRVQPGRDEPLTRDSLAAYHREKLRETVAYARQSSPFYRDRLAGLVEVEVLHPARDPDLDALEARLVGGAHARLPAP